MISAVVLHPLYRVLTKLDAAKIHYLIFRSQSDSVTIVATPITGLRLEIDVFEDGHIEYCKFEGDETPIENDAALDRLIDGVVALNEKYERLSQEKLTRK
jgi:hypothetical protein